MDIDGEEDIPIIVNRCYGGFALSRHAMDEYLKRSLALNPEFTMTDKIDEDYRDDPLMAQIVLDLGNDASDSLANLQIKYIKRKFKDHYTISDYDGQESLRINYATYRLSCALSVLEDIKKIIQSDVTAIEKVTKVNEMFNK